MWSASLVVVLLAALSVLTGQGEARTLPQPDGVASSTLAPPEPCICTLEYAPVCGVTADDQVTTYGNKCGAACAAAKVLYSGECDPCVCPAIYKPVCARTLFKQLKTYSNSCAAACVNATVVSQRPCPKLPKPCVCNKIYAPVCGIDGKTYGNACEAGCAGVPSTPGECPSDADDCVCTEEYAPVCGVDGKTYSNKCRAACAGVEIANQGKCSDPNVVIVGEGESCGGFRMPPIPQCEDGLYCKFLEPTGDAGGICTKKE